MEEDVHHDDGPQVKQAVHADVPHLSLSPAQIRLIHLQGAAHTHVNKVCFNSQNFLCVLMLRNYYIIRVHVRKTALLLFSC